MTNFEFPITNFNDHLRPINSNNQLGALTSIFANNYNDHIHATNFDNQLSLVNNFDDEHQQQPSHDELQQPISISIIRGHVSKP